MASYYEILGVKQGATSDEIEKAWKRVRSKHHPDKGGDEAKFKEAMKAYDTLSDPQKRRQYDQFGAEFAEQFGGDPGPTVDPDFAEILRQMRERQGNQNKQWRMATIDVGIPADAMINGGRIPVRYPIPGNTLGSFNFNIIEVDIPAGIKVGQHFRKPGLEDVTFVARAASSPGCAVQGLDLVIPVPVNVAHIMCGVAVKVRHPSGKIYEVKVPEGAKHGSAARLQGQGLEHVNGAKGNLLVAFDLIVPKLDENQKKVMKEAFGLG